MFGMGLLGLVAAQRWTSRASLAASVDRGERRHETALKTNTRFEAAPAASRAGHVGRRVDRSATHVKQLPDSTTGYHLSFYRCSISRLIMRVLM